MNTFACSGKVVRKALVSGEKIKVLRFVVAAKYGHDGKTKKNKVSLVPCVIFNPSEALVNLFARECENLFVEFSGHIAMSEFEIRGTLLLFCLIFAKSLNIIYLLLGMIRRGAHGFWRRATIHHAHPR